MIPNKRVPAGHTREIQLSYFCLAGAARRDWKLFGVSALNGEGTSVDTGMNREGRFR